MSNPPPRAPSNHPPRLMRPDILFTDPYAPGEQPLSHDVIKLNTNESPYRASEKIYAAAARALERGLARYPDPTASAFREAAARLHGVPADWILCGNGSDDLLWILSRAYVNPGDRVRMPYPCYYLYKVMGQLQGAALELVRYEPDWSLPDAFAADPLPRERLRPVAGTRPARAGSRLKLAFLPNPSSPAGTRIEPDRMLDLARRLPCPLVIDEAYADFTDVNCIDLVRQSDQVIICRTLSKAYALAGLRFGYLIARPEIIRQLAKLKNVYDCDSVSIAAATAAIEDQDWLREQCAKIIATRRRLTTELRRMGFNTVESHTNFVWNTHPEQPLLPLYHHVREHGILLRYFDYPEWGDGLRISVGTDEQIDRCLDLIEGYLRKR